MYPIANFTFDEYSSEKQDSMKAWYTKNCIDCSVQIAELCFHVDSTLAAYGTFIGRLHMSIVARSVDAMPTEHEDNR